ncbi:hypothetical protein [Polaromonas sp. JS666]|uniref:hypothetical protein n=1 Tax=Polaromonas sp. (strain JS666 / ATCC BAA-500) TaxID=296591 RepID=UPI0000464B43|nr:hypothetical protein [Polaromonas sp. JS666]
MQLNCPCCHARYPFEAALQDDAAREVNGLLVVMQPQLMRPLISYIGLFRSAGRQLAWERALRLMQETLNLAPFNPAALESALVDTIAAMDEKRGQGGFKPLANHNYLKRVIESTTARQEAASSLVQTPLDGAPPARVPKSKSGQAVVALEGMKR